ncbi:ABC transporter substrate-binding protein [Nocardioides pacificus]
MGAGTGAGVEGGAVAGTGTGTDGTGTGTDGTGGTAGTDGTSGTTGGGAGGDSGGGAPGEAAPASGENAADGGTKAGSCDGFKNTTGITDSKITVANIADISGPVPGIFESAQEATRAYAAFFNSTGDVCGRKIDVTLLDSRADAGADQQAYTKACESAFAAVGSMSAFDSGGAKVAEGCGLPDMRSTSVNPERRACSTCFSAQSVAPNMIPAAIPKYINTKYGDASKKAAMLWINAGAAPINAKSFAKGYEMNGWDVVYEQGIDVAEFNYAPYVQQMKDKGVEVVQYMGNYQNAVRLKQAMKQQGFSPKVFLLDATGYDARYVEQAGGDGDGTLVYMNNQMFEDTSIKEMALYRSWLQQVKPGAVPNFYGLYAWSAARLFVERSIALGGKLTRQSLVAELAKIKDWTGNGLHAPMDVGAKMTAECTKFIELKGGKWSQVSSGDFLCGPLSNSGIGG